MSHKARATAKAIIQHYESCRLKAYQDTAGKWTVGWGHTKTASRGMEINQAMADDLLHRDLEAHDPAINYPSIKTLEPHEHGALWSARYNLRARNFIPPSSLGEALVNGWWEHVPDELRKLVYDVEGNKLLGLQRRRECEALVWEGMGVDEAIVVANLRFPGALRLGSRGPEVRELQENLRRFRDKIRVFDSHRIQVDGVFGRETRAHVMFAQSWLGLTPDGIVGPATAAALEAALEDVGND